MTTYYLDTNALIKRYVQETGTDWIKSLMAPDASNMLIAPQTMSLPN
jgi:predicted nucleic acid-binding protein